MPDLWSLSNHSKIAYLIPLPSCSARKISRASSAAILHCRPRTDWDAKCCRRPAYSPDSYWGQMPARLHCGGGAERKGLLTTAFVPLTATSRHLFGFCAILPASILPNPFRPIIDSPNRLEPKIVARRRRRGRKTPFSLILLSEPMGVQGSSPRVLPKATKTVDFTIF